MAYRLRGPVDGEPGHRGTFDTLAEAQSAAQRFLTRLSTRASGITVRAWGERYLENHVRLAPGTLRTTRRNLDRIYDLDPTIPAKLIRDLRRLDVENLIEAASVARTPKGTLLRANTIATLLGSLSRICAYAVRKNKAAANPCVGVRVPPDEGNKRQYSWLSDPADRERVVHAWDGRDPVTGRRWIAAMIALYGGLRVGEVYGLHWHHVGSDRLRVETSWGAARTKSGKAREIPLLPPLRDALERWRHAGGVIAMAGPVVPRGTRTAAQMANRGSDDWRALRSQIGVPPIRFHELRHTYASCLVSGAWGHAWRLEEIQALLGHSTLAQTQIYAHLDPGRIARVAATASASWVGV